MCRVVRLLYFASSLLHQHPYHHNLQTGSMAVPDAQRTALTFLDLPTAIYIAIAGYLPAHCLVRIGGASRWCHSFFPPLATGNLVVTSWAFYMSSPHRPSYRSTQHEPALARLLRQMPRLYIVALRGHDSSIASVAENINSSVRNFELSHVTTLVRGYNRPFLLSKELILESIYTFYVSGRAALPQSNLKPKEVRHYIGSAPHAWQT